MEFNNKLFVEGDDRLERAYFGWEDSITKLESIKNGYKMAADDLVGIVLEKRENCVLEQYIYPIMFLYRHSIEISLKSIYFRVYGNSKKLKGGHSLDDLWKNCYTEIESTLNKKFDEKIKANVSNFLLELTKATTNKKVDCKAEVWRYSYDKNNKKFFPNKEAKMIDYKNLKYGMSQLYDALDYLYDVVDEILSRKC
ncbi:hypothetical protein AAGC94_18640 [Clostridium sporogenes]|uniref:HEPN domain-containing protein n=1 Tax=Clostridium cochlearium TaxID=1494 RepID=A0A2X2VWJ4_CLOCO|nr:hypothetical protein [Clostridium cochlearium]MBE6161915.1 hypothetical protein [Bacillota bacterium]SQB33586.1 Uncharacterised protein [Clostridium cochlearium]